MNETADTPATPDIPDSPAPNPREEAMAAIERQNNERIAKELGIQLDDVQAPSADIDADPDEAVAEAERQRLERAAAAVDQQAQLEQQLQSRPDKPAAKPAEATVLENFDNVMVKTKVDGEEVLRPLSELVRIGQKEAAVNKRLEQAAQLRQEAERLYANARSQPNQESKAPAAGDTPPVGKEFLDAIYSGEEDKALAAMQQLFGKGRDAATPDPMAIAKQVKAQIDTDTALESFGSQYPEIVADPYLADVADRYLGAELEMGTPFRDALNKAGTATRDWLQQKAGNITPPKTQPTSLDDKRVRKQAIDMLPSIHAAATTSREPAEPSVSEVLDEMRKARGLAY